MNKTTKPAPQLCCLGEAIIDFASVQDLSAPELPLRYERCAGGAPANVAVAAQRLGTPSALIACVGNDMHGRFLAQAIEAEGVDVSGIQRSQSSNTTLAFVNNEANGERTFSFYRSPGADTDLKFQDIPPRLLNEARILQFGSLSLTHEPARAATHLAIELAKASGAKIAMDPNFRDSLWPSPNAAVVSINEVLPLVDFLKVSEEEAALLSGQSNPMLAAKALGRRGPNLVVVTQGRLGNTYDSPGASGTGPGFPTKPIDTNGAGDSFWAAFLSYLLRQADELDRFSKDRLDEASHFANAAAALTVQGRGAIPSMPRIHELEPFLNRRRAV